MDDFSKTIDECLKILEENVDVLANLEMDLEDEKEDEVVPSLELHDLYDMAEDVTHTSKIKRAETNLVRRQTENM
ncbi:MAG: hypothetical protein ACE5RO_05005 [Candidatus Nitrosomaritimum yanchengensis]